MNNSIYAQDGVDTDMGDAASKAAFEVCKSTFDNCDFACVEQFGNFRGPRVVKFNKGFWKESFGSGAEADGLGTKPIVVDAADLHINSGRDLFAMLTIDMIRNGGLPIHLESNLEVSSLGENIESDEFKAALNIYKGMGNAANETNIIILTGETAETGVLIGSDNSSPTLKFTLSGVVNGVYDSERMITGDTLAADQVLMVMQEGGLGCNGVSTFRKGMHMKFGENWFNNPEALKYIKMGAEPCSLYDNFFTRINGWGKNPEDYIKVHSLIHLTGGSFESKLGEDILFPRGLSADLNDLFPVPEIQRLCADWRGMSVEDLYDTWHGGQRMLAVIDRCNVDRFTYLSNVMGFNTKKCGVILDESSNSIRIKPKLLGEDIIYTG